jgi:transcription elongation factor Elf1
MQNLLWCKNCDTPKWLVSIEPDKLNHDRRTFECPRCQELTVVVINIGPEEG